MCPGGRGEGRVSSVKVKFKTHLSDHLIYQFTILLSLYSYYGDLRHSKMAFSCSLSLNVPKLALLSETILYISSFPMLHFLWLVLYFNQSNYAQNLGNASGFSDPMQKVEFKGFAGIVEQTRGAFHKLQVNGATSN